MKKGIKTSLMFVMLCFVTFCFVGCGPKIDIVKTQLIIPEAPVVIETENNIVVKTNTVDNAISYNFYINNVIINSVSNELDCTDIITDFMAYSIKVVAVGDDKNYTNSDVSDTYVYNKDTELSTPIISIDGTVISWSKILDANDYTLSFNSEKEIIVIGTSYDFSNNQEIMDATSFAGDYNFKLRANGREFYKESEYSNEIIYSVRSKLTTPTNLNVSTSYIASWNSVEYAINYKVELNGVVIEEDVTSTQIDLKKYLIDARDYKIRVKAITDNDLCEDSDFCNEVDFDYYITLSSPVVNNVEYSNDTVNVTWDVSENTQTYTLYINDIKYGRLIWTNNINISKDYMSGFLAPYNFKVRANGYNHYIESGYSNIVSLNNFGKLTTPENIKVQKVGTNYSCSFDSVLNAERYTIIINDGVELISSSTVVDVTKYITEPMDYTFKIKANQAGDYLQSDFSQKIVFKNIGKFLSPSELNVDIVNQELYASWNTVEYAMSYNIIVTYREDVDNEEIEIVNEDIKNTSFTRELNNAGYYSVKVKANGYDNYLESEYCDSQEKINITKISAPTNLYVEKNIDNIRISWDEVENIDKYILSINDEEFELYNNYKEMPLITLEEQTYYFKVKAITPEGSLYPSSDYSLPISYTYGEEILNGDTYFYNGEVKDYYINSQEELNNVVGFALLNRFGNISISVSFNYTTSLLDEYFYTEYANLIGYNEEYLQNDITIKNEIQTALLSYRDYNIYNASYIDKDNGNFDITFSYVQSFEPSKDSTQEVKTQDESFIQNVSSVKRVDTFDSFAIELVSQTIIVNNTDQLVYGVMYLNRKPIFVDGSIAQSIYEQAKDILRDIVNDDMNSYEKVLAIYDYLSYNTTVDKTAVVSDNNLKYDYKSCFVEGVFENNIASSEGISKALTLLCAIEGIDSRIAFGTFNNEPHWWNKVFVDDYWYNIDVSTGSISLDDKIILSHCNAFMISDDLMILSNYQEQSLNMAKANGNKYEYYQNGIITDIKDLTISSEKEFQDTVLAYIGNSNYGLEFKLGDEVTIEDFNLWYNNTLDAYSLYFAVNNITIEKHVYNDKYIFVEYTQN